MKRDNTWLASRLDFLWRNHFSDVERQNTVVIRFGRWSRYQFGIITYNKYQNVSKITINHMFSSEDVPQTIVDHTIAHELVHYTHGFSSPRKRLHKYPHHGGIVNKELDRRGLKPLLVEYRKWLKEYRKSLIKH